MDIFFKLITQENWQKSKENISSSLFQRLQDNFIKKYIKDPFLHILLDQKYDILILIIHNFETECI